MAAIGEINQQPDGKPDEEAEPGDDGESCHKQEAEDNAEEGDNRAARNAKATATLWFAQAQNNHANRNQNESEERADVGKVGQSSDIE